MSIFKANEGVVTYTINKNFNNNLYISVQNGEVVVRAPWYLSKNQIQEKVEEKKNWIIQKIKEYEELKDYIRKETVKILGEDCRVIVNYKNLKKPKLTVEGKNIKVYLPNKYKNTDRDEILKLLIEKMYDVIAKKEIENAMEKIRIMIGIAPEDYKIVRNKKVLAKCLDNRTIIINPDIMQYSKETIEYVILHQFCHLKYKTHAKGFYEMIKKHMPDYIKYEEEIKDWTI